MPYKNGAATFFVDGFNRARSQLELKLPEADLSFLDVGKVVKEGQLVEDSDEEEEQEDEEVDQPTAAGDGKAEPPKGDATVVLVDDDEEACPTA